MSKMKTVMLTEVFMTMTDNPAVWYHSENGDMQPSQGDSHLPAMLGVQCRHAGFVGGAHLERQGVFHTWLNQTQL